MFKETLKSSDGGFLLKEKYDGLLNKYLVGRVKTVVEILEILSHSSILVALFSRIFASSPMAMWSLLNSIQ